MDDYFPELNNHKIVIPESKYGILNVGLSRCNGNYTGCRWSYTYYDLDTCKLKTLSSYDLRKLREKVLNHGFDWVITDNRKAIDTYKLNNKLMDKHNDLVGSRQNLKLSMKRNSTSFYRVGKNTNYIYSKGYNWKYRYYVNKELKTIVSTDLKILKSKVLKSGLEWKVLDKSKAVKTAKSEGYDLGELL